MVRSVDPWRLAGSASRGLLLLGVLSGGAARAGSATAESIWNQANALEQARQQVPAGATVTREICSEIEVGMSPRYRCSVEWQPAPAAASEANPDPANSTPPGR